LLYIADRFYLPYLFVYIGVIVMIEDNELVRLEKFVSTLLEKFNALQVQNKELTDRLLRREVTIETLQDDLASMKNERGDISSRVSSLIGKIEEWEAAGEASIENDESAAKSSDSGVQGNLFTVDAQGAHNSHNDNNETPLS
jgi:predicted nuclease with TOPRIM domain